MSETQHEIEKISKIIQTGQSFLVVAHKSVDGDAYGSSMAMYFSLLSLGKRVEVLNELPPTPLFSWLGIHNLVHSEIIAKKFDAILVCDCGDIRLIGKPLENYPDIFENTPIINIDHHPTNPLFGTYNLVDTGASSTCELIYDLLRRMDVKVNTQIATLLLFGIIRDTNCFRNSIRPNTFAMTSELLALGADYDQIISETYRREKLNYLGLYGHILSNLISLRWGRIVGGVITQELFKKYDIPENEFGPQFINETLAAIGGADFVFLIKEIWSGENKLGFRARTDECDVLKIAEKFGGGWHVRASGATTTLSSEEIIKILNSL